MSEGREIHDMAESFLNRFINNQEKAVKYHLLHAIGVIILGVLILITAFLLKTSNAQTSEFLKTSVLIGGGFIASLSTFPIKEIITRKERLSVLQSVKLLIQTANKEDQDRIQELVWKAIEKNTVG